MGRVTQVIRNVLGAATSRRKSAKVVPMHMDEEELSAITPVVGGQVSTSCELLEVASAKCSKNSKAAPKVEADGELDDELDMDPSSWSRGNTESTTASGLEEVDFDGDDLEDFTNKVSWSSSLDSLAYSTENDSEEGLQ